MRKFIFILICFLCLGSIKNSFSQANFYDVDSIREIKIYFAEPNWDYILDSFYVAGLEERLTATYMRIDGVQLDSVGVRYKGYSSVSINRINLPSQ